MRTLRLPARWRTLGLALLLLPTARDRVEAAGPRPIYPPLRLAGADGLGLHGSATPAAPAAAPAPHAGGPIQPDERWCGIQSLRPPPEPPLPCKLPGLPCGPVTAAEISRGAGEVSEDLDGDGQTDLTLAGRREVPHPQSYAAIYRSTDAGYVLADYHAVPPRAEPTVASVLLAAPGSAPLLRDGYDVLEAGGRTVSIARLRRFDGHGFRTLLTFCAHRAEPVAGGLREGHNRVEILDVDKDGQKDIVVHGLIHPMVFRFTDGGLSLVEDTTLTRLYYDSSPEIRRARELRIEAARLVESGQIRRAAETLQRASASMPYDVNLTIELCTLLVRAGQADRAVELLGRARYQAPDRAPVYCALARAYRAQGPLAAAAERNALHSCLSKEPDEALRSEAEARLRELAGRPGGHATGPTGAGSVTPASHDSTAPLDLP